MISKVSFGSNDYNYPTIGIKRATEKVYKLDDVYPMSESDSRLKFLDLDFNAQNIVLGKNDEKLAAQLDLISEQNKYLISQCSKLQDKLSHVHYELSSGKDSFRV